MASSTVLESQATVHTAAHARSYLVSGNAATIRRAPDYTKSGDDSMIDHDADGLGCARGLRAAFIVEAVAAFCLYGVWHLFHVVR